MACSPACGQENCARWPKPAGSPCSPAWGEHELREAIRASNAASARAAGVPVDHLPTLTAQEAHRLARQLSGEPARPDQPE